MNSPPIVHIVRSGAFAVLTICAALPSAHCQFLSPIIHDDDVHPTNIALGDMNNDGIHDVVASHPGSPQGISIFVNDGHGFLSPYVFLGPGVLSPIDFKLADLDGNGFLDIIMSDSGISGISVLLGSGTKIFGPLKTHPAPSATSIAVADITGDGILDVLGILPSDASLAIGNGDGTFEAAPNIPIGGSPQGIAVADVNGDGILDFATALPSLDVVHVKIGTGGGVFVDGGNFPTGQQPNDLAFGDVNGDGKLDLVVTNFFSHNVTVLIGDGTGMFGPSQTLMAMNSPVSPRIADFNADGIVDIAVVNMHAPFVSSFKGTGGGFFDSQTPSMTGAVGARDMDAADLDGNGIPDLAIANAGDNDVSILLAAASTCTQVLQSVQSVRLGSPPNPPALVPDPTHGPVIGFTWQPFISHASFAPSALADVLIISIEAVNIPSSFGTLLCDISKPHVLITVPSGQPFVIPVPALCALIGFTIKCQGASLSLFSNKLTNAIDATIGTF